MVIKTTAYTFARKILSSVVRKTKFVSKIYKKVLISISEKRMPMHDCSEKHKRKIGRVLIVSIPEGQKKTSKY